MNHQKMKAVVVNAYGNPEVLQLKEVDIPRPNENEVRIKIHTTTVTAADTMMRKGSPYIGRLYLGLLRPKRTTPGVEFSGVVESVGQAVSRFKKGDLVFGETTDLGCYAEYICIPEDGAILRKPEHISNEEITPISGGALTSINFLKGLANIQSGQSVLINGASGSLGTYAVQLAKSFGAKVTGVCSTKNLDLVKRLGADQVIDYTTTDFTKSTETYDIIFDTVGKLSYPNCKMNLKEKGIFLSPILKVSDLFRMLWTSVFGKKKVMFSATGMLPIEERIVFLKELKTLVQNGQLKTVIDRSYPLEQIVEAHSYVDKGHKIGNVVIHINQHN